MAQKPIKKKLTKTVIDGAKPTKQRYHVQDTILPGYALRVYPTGRKSYILDYREISTGKRKCYTIGNCDILTPDQARETAIEKLNDIKNGIDINLEKEKRNIIPTFKDFVEEYIERYAKVRKKDSSVRHDRQLCEAYIITEFGNKRVDMIDDYMVQRLHSKITICSPFKEKPAPVAANRIVLLLSKMMNLCEDWGYRPPGTNPCKKVALNPEGRRNRYLDPDKEIDPLTEKELGPGELERFLIACKNALDDNSENPRVIFLFLTILVTGCRKSEIILLKKSELNLQRGFIKKDDHKGRRKNQIKPKIIELNKLAASILRHVLINHSNECEWVFESHRRKGRPYNNIIKPWNRVVKKAKIKDFRIHDSRHTFTSILVNSDVSVSVIQGLLGHSDYKQTEGYAHLFRKKKQSASEAITDVVGQFFQLPEKEVSLLEDEKQRNK